MKKETSEAASLSYAEDVIATLREPFVVLTKSLRVKTANRSFYETFHVLPEATENQFIYDLGNRQWNIPKLRKLLEEVLSDHRAVHDFEVEHIFPTIGERIMLLNAHRVCGVHHSDLILLAIEDITDRRRAEAEVKNSELRYRRLFETAQDAILILDAGTKKILDANPFIEDLLGYSKREFVDKELWQLGLFQDIEESKAAFRELQEQGHIRYENLPLEPDFVLLDIGLPGMDGYEVAQRLRHQPQTKDVWLIAMTGYGQESDRQRTQEAGFDHHLVKPFDQQKLQNLLGTLANQPHAAK